MPYCLAPRNSREHNHPVSPSEQIRSPPRAPGSSLRTRAGCDLGCSISRWRDGLCTHRRAAANPALAICPRHCAHAPTTATTVSPRRDHRTNATCRPFVANHRSRKRDEPGLNRRTPQMSIGCACLVSAWAHRQPAPEQLLRLRMTPTPARPFGAPRWLDPCRPTHDRCRFARESISRRSPRSPWPGLPARRTSPVQPRAGASCYCVGRFRPRPARSRGRYRPG